MIPEYITGPLIGAIIGSFTNFIAVKMLFYPRKEILLFGHPLPFTPGVIPKGKERLAGTIGNTVASSLLTKSDIEAMVLSKEIEDEVCETVLKHLTINLKDEICVLSGARTEEYEKKKDELCALISRKIVESIDVVKLMDDYGSEYIINKIHSRRSTGDPCKGGRLICKAHSGGKTFTDRFKIRRGHHAVYGNGRWSS